MTTAEPITGADEKSRTAQLSSSAQSEKMRKEMGFKRTEVNELLALCHRRCCVCHRFCGTKIEIHHIQPSEAGGEDSIENATPLCFECHAEVQLYND